MDRDVRLAALRATAKVAFSLSSLVIVACGGTQPAPEVAVDPAQAKPVPKPGPATTAQADPASPYASSGYVAGHKTCKAVLDDAFAQTPAKPTPEVQACCREMVKSFDDPAHSDECCYTFRLDPEMRMGCSPWGPPVPPRMRV